MNPSLKTVPPQIADDSGQAAVLRAKWQAKEEVISHLVTLFDNSGEIRNTTKLFKDMLEREKKGTTAIGGGIAIPHSRSMQPRKPVVCIARSKEGVEFLADDGSPVHLIFAVTAPDYEPEMYLKIYSWISRLFMENNWLYDALMDAEDEHEIVSIIRGMS